MYPSAKWLTETGGIMAAGERVFFNADSLQLTEAVELSHEQVRDALHDALKALIPEKPGYYSWVSEVYDDYLIYNEETPTASQLYRRSYTINESGEAMLGGATKVEKQVSYVDVGEAARKPAAVKKEAKAETELVGAIIPLIEKSIRPDGTVPVKIIEPGWGASAFYPAAVLERDGPSVFTRGTHMFWDHPTEVEEAEKPEGSLARLAATLESDARWDPSGPKGPGLYADAKVFGPFDESLNDLAPHIGLSIRTRGIAESGEVEGREGPILTELLKTPFTSVDFVTKAGAGGEVLQLFESVRPHKTPGGLSPMEAIELKETKDKLAAAETELAEFKAQEAARLAEETGKRLSEEATTAITEALKDKDLPEPTKVRVIEALSKEPPSKDGALDTEALLVKVTETITAEAAYLEKLTGLGAPRGVGSSGEPDEKKKLEESVRRFHPDFTEDQVRIFVHGR